MGKKQNIYYLLLLSGAHNERGSKKSTLRLFTPMYIVGFCYYYYSIIFFRPMPSGFTNQSDHLAMRIIFRAILPIHCWDINGGKSLVYLRFGNKELGKWEYDFGPGDVERYIISVLY